MDYVPLEILYNIALSSGSVKSLISLCSTCKTYRVLLSDLNIWKNIFLMKDFRVEKLVKGTSAVDYMNIYREERDLLRNARNQIMENMEKGYVYQLAVSDLLPIYSNTITLSDMSKVVHHDIFTYNQERILKSIDIDDESDEYFYLLYDKIELKYLPDRFIICYNNDGYVDTLYLNVHIMKKLLHLLLKNEVCIIVFNEEGEACMYKR